MQASTDALSFLSRNDANANTRESLAPQASIAFVHSGVSGPPSACPFQCCAVADAFEDLPAIRRVLLVVVVPMYWALRPGNPQVPKMRSTKPSFATAGEVAVPRGGRHANRGAGPIDDPSRHVRSA